MEAQAVLLNSTLTTTDSVPQSTPAKSKFTKQSGSEMRTQRGLHDAQNISGCLTTELSHPLGLGSGRNPPITGPLRELGRICQAAQLTTNNASPGFGESHPPEHQPKTQRCQTRRGPMSCKSPETNPYKLMVNCAGNYVYSVTCATCGRRCLICCFMAFRDIGNTESGWWLLGRNSRLLLDRHVNGSRLRPALAAQALEQ